MRHVWKFVSAAILATVICSSSAQAQEWNEVRSQNLRMLTNGSTKQASAALWKLEQARVVFGHLLNRSKLNRNRPLVLVGLQSASEVRALTNAELVPGGFALSAKFRNYLVGDLSAPDWSGLYRAYALLLLDANYPRTQPWFDEGLAEYIAGLNIESKQITEVAPSQLGNELKSEPLMPLQVLLGPDASSQPHFEATAYVLVRWLIENGQFENAGPYFNQVMNQSVPPANAFQQAFSIAPTAMDEALAKYKASLGPKLVAQPMELDTLSFVPTKVVPDEAKAMLAEVKLEQPATEAQAFATLQQMQQQNPDNVEVHRGLGLAYLRRGDLQNFADHIRRAIEIRDDSGLMHYLIAVWRNRGSSEGIQVDSEGPTIVMQCEKAIDLDPELAPAYQLLAEGLVATRHPDKALQTIRKGMALAPRDEHLMLTFASTEIANSSFDQARGLLKFLQTSDDRSVATRAKEMLASATRKKKSEQELAEQAQRYTDPTDPRWKPKEDSATAEKPETEGTAEAKPDTRKTEYLKGTLVGVQCPDERSAQLTVVANRKTWKFNVPDRSKVLLIGQDKFECSWKNVQVSVNYKASGAGTGDLVSLEVD